jgi:hypothetical protein
MEASSPPGRHHELWYVLIYYVLEGKEKRQKEKDRDRKREKERDVIFCLNLLFIRFCFFTHSINIFFVLRFSHAGILLSALTGICTISEMTDILLSALTGMCFYYSMQLCLVLYVVCGTYWYFFVYCQHLLACCLTGLLSCLVVL